MELLYIVCWLQWPTEARGCFPSQKCIAEALGYSRATVNRAIKALKKHGLIGVDRRSRHHCTYRLLKVRCSTDKTQMSDERNSDYQVNTNNNKFTRNNNNIDD